MRYSFLKRQSLFCLSGLLLLLSGCGVLSSQQSSSQPSADAGNESAIASSQADPAQTDPSNPAVSQPFAPSTEDGAAASTPGQPIGRLPAAIVPATTEAGRLPQIQPGRQDPFAPIATSTAVVASARPSAARSPQQSVQGGQPIPLVPAATAPPAVIPIPLAPPAPSAGLIPTPVPVPLVPTTSQPTVGTGGVPSVGQPTSPGLEFSGVVQVGDRVNIIVKEPGTSGSRYIQVGDSVANGQFIVKAVDFNRGPNPAVILDQAGTEVVHWVGSSSGF